MLRERSRSASNGMKLLTVVPIAKGILHDRLTYFAKEGAPLGTVIMVPLRSREVPALVLEVSDIAPTKTVLKTSDYAIRKIARIKPITIWDPEFIRASDITARYHAQHFGEVLISLTPKTILDALIEGTISVPAKKASEEPDARFRISAIQADTQTRLESYQRLIRESFAQNKSVFICLPTELDVERVSKTISRGIEDYVYELSKSTSKKKLLSAWEKIHREPHAIVVIATAQYLSINRHFSTIIIDEEHTRAWNTIVEPHIDLRLFIESFARESKSSLLLGAPILRAETHARIEDGTIQEFGRLFTRARLPDRVIPLETILLDPRADERDEKERTRRRSAFKMFSKQTESLMRDAQEAKESVFLLASRKGLSPTTICGDCGTTIKCPACESALVIHKKTDGTNIFSCHACGMIRMPEDGDHEVCPNCKGWRLEGLGIGVQKIEEAVRAVSPNTPIFTFDGDSVKTQAQAKKLIAQFEKAREERLAPVLIGTPMAIPYLGEADHTIIVSIDSLFAIPDIRMNERIFALILALREKSAHTLTVQTRMDDTHLFIQALEGELSEFTKEELSLRKAFSYSPYGTIIKITIRNKKELVQKEITNIQEFLKPYNPITPPTMSKNAQGLFQMHVIIKLPLGFWGSSQEEARVLLAKLQSLPRQFSIEINPDHLL